MTKPVIAAIQGYCLGGAAELALHADFRIAADDATIAFPEASLGLLPVWGGSQLLPRIVGRGRALDLLLTGRRLSGEEAASIGLVTESVPSERVLTRANTLAAFLATIPILSVRLIKRSVAMSYLPIGEGLQLERDFLAYLVLEERLNDSVASAGVTA
jgi:enoyl-CoA hydratase/carnithine racemase